MKKRKPLKQPEKKNTIKNKGKNHSRFLIRNAASQKKVK